MNIYIIILHYGDIRTTQDCVTSLYKNDNDFTKIIIVNNAQQKISARDFSKEKEKIEIINNERNVGFAGGVNIGIRKALALKAEYILLLNNDTNINRSLVKPLVRFLQKETSVGIVGPAIEFMRSGQHLYDLGGTVNRMVGRTSHEEVGMIIDAMPREVGYITGACMMIRAEVFTVVGLFDEQYFLYYEDVDFSLRAKDTGFLSYVLPSIIIHHALSKSAGGVSPLAVYHQTRSGVLFGKKWCKVRILNLLFLFAQSVLFLSKKSELGIAAFQGLWDGIRVA